MLSESTPREEELEGYLHDEDSLFGSPPPSPSARGRSPSPTLALPSTLSGASQAPSTSSVAQNVGNIALTRSQTHSENSINPLALSLSLPGGSFTPVLPQSVPSSLSTQPQRQVSHEPLDASRPSSSSSSRASPASIIRRKAAQPRKRARNSQSKESTPHTPTTEISLPDPSQPLPPRFLRNQQGLLGHAGLIAGVKPAKLATLFGTPRGSSSSNPIVLDENGVEAPALPVTPMIGRSHVKYMDKLDLSKLPTPTNQEIVEMLIKQKDIFPVLENLLKLSSFAISSNQVIPSNHQTLNTGARPITPAFSAAQFCSSSQPPAKRQRRKLNNVPAGAADWDVPYPFAEGEGPEAYKKNWMKQRRKQLIQQLVGLIKIATRKAAAKKYVMEIEKARLRQLQGSGKMNEVEKTDRHQDNDAVEREHGIGKECVTGSEQMRQGSEQGHGYSDFYQPGITAFDLMPQTSGGNDYDAGHPAMHHTSVSSESQASLSNKVMPIENGNASFTTPFDQLISSLLTTPSEFRYATGAPTPFSPSSSHQATPSDQLSPFDLTSTGGNIDQALVDHWVSFLQSFPPSEGFGTDPWSPSHYEPSDMETLFGTSPFTGNLSTFASPLNGDLSSFTTTPTLDAQQNSGFPGLEQLGLDGMTGGDMFIGSQPRMGMTEDNKGDIVPQCDIIPVDFNPNLSLTPEVGSETSSQATTITQSSFMEVDRVSSSVDLANVGQSTSYLHYQQINNDPHALLAMSLSPPHTYAPMVSESSTHSLALPVPPIGPGNDHITFSPSIVPSPMSSVDPATPSSAGWDMSIPEVVGEEQDRGQGLSAKNFEKSIPRILESCDVSAMATDARDNSSLEVLANPSSTFEILRLDAEGGLTTEAQRPKLAKSDVLRRAEEKRTQLKSDLEKVKMKLWESSVEHGALLHLMRISGEVLNKSNAV